MDTKEAGRLGGQARMKALSALQRASLATLAAKTRWGDAKPLALHHISKLESQTYTPDFKLCKHGRGENLCEFGC